MKPDGATMETPELSEAAAIAERSSQENINEEAQIQPEGAAPAETQKANGKPLAADPKIKPKAAGSKIQQTSCAGAAGSSSRLGTVSHRTERDIKSSSAGRKAAAAAAGGGVAASKPSAAGAVPKRPVGVPAVSSTAKNQPRAFERKPVGPVKTADATVTNGTKLRVAPNGISRKPAAEAANGARPKTTAATNRPVASAAPKPNASNTTKPAAPASSRTTRPAAGPSTSRATSTFSKPAAAATTKISTTATSRVASSRAAAAPSAGRSAGAQLNKNPPAKKGVSRPPSAAAAKKPLTTTPTASPVAKTKETSKTTTAVKPNSAPTATKAADPKASLGKVQSVVKQTKKPAAAARFPPSTRPPLGRTPPCSPAGRPLTPSAKRGTTKPTQTVSPFTQKAAKVALPVAEPQIAAPSATAAESAQVADAVTAVTTAAVVSAVEEVQTLQRRAAEPEEVAQHINTTSPPTSPPFREQSEDRAAPLPEPEQVSSPAKPSSPTVASSSARLPQEADQSASTHAVNPIEPSTAQMAAAIINLNEEEDEEEREGSQLVSVSEMSGTTQPTEESRPGSGGPVGRAAWKAGSALLSELDSEDVSGSQQGASELSAPGVLEGTESTDDLGDGSLKGAIDMELASVGSPDFEKVPDIPANEFEDEDEDDSDRVCDMEVGSERADEPRRPRHDNDVDEDEDDDDVEMASEGVTESGLESYGNADEDDFAEDNLDNLNRVPLPPPPPVLPSAPAAQWDQPNPFASPWEEPPQSHIPGESKASANCEASAQSAEQTWLEVGPGPSALERQDVCHHSSVPNEPQNVEPVGPARETALPGDQGDQEGKLPAQVFEASALSSQPDGDCQDARVERGEQEEEEEEAEPETLPADEVLGGPSTAPTSNPSSSSVTEDEASDTEGEAQLDKSMKCPPVSNLTFDMQPPLPQRCLSTVEEGEEVESFIADEATPPSAASLASYNFDSVTTASNSNAQSTGESCIKSPGIFSLEELSEEAKEPCLNPEPDAQRHAAEYIECGKQQEAEAAERVESELPGSEAAAAKPEEIAEDIQPPYYSTICEKTEDSFAGFAAIPHPHRRDHSSYPRTFCDLVKPVISAAASPKLTCTDLPPRSLGQQALSPQLRRLEQHQRQLLELQQRRAQQSRPLEEAEQERKRRVEEEQRKKKEEAEEEIKRNKADEERRRKEEEQELQQRRGLELQLQQQQQELQQRQQIMQWQQELQQSNKSQTALLSPSSGLCTIYEALESSEDEETPERNPDPDPTQPGPDPHEQMCPSCDSDRLSPERPPPLDLDWGKKVDIVQQLINQTLLLNGDGCSSLLLLPGGAGGTLSPLESSLWPSLLPPLTPPSATVTSVSSFSPEATGSSPQGEWTVVELETHH